MAIIKEAAKDWIGIDNFVEEILEKFPEATIDLRISNDYSGIKVNLEPNSTKPKRYGMSGPEFRPILSNMYESMKNMDL